MRICLHACMCLCSFTECWECKGSEAETLPRVLSGRQIHAAERTGKGGGGGGASLDFQYFRNLLFMCFGTHDWPLL